MIGIRRKKIKMNPLNIKNIMENIPLRVSITDFCNLNCFFCSNEGMDMNLKNKNISNLNSLLYLIKLLRHKGLKKISLTGGEPSIYPEIDKLLREINKLNFDKTFFHTNGVLLNEKLIKGPLKKFSKIAISIHSIDFNEWKNMTGGKKAQFEKIIKNLDLLYEEGYGNRVEIKIVPIKSKNFSEESIKKTLDFCNKRGFKFKFLIFEPIKKEHLDLVIGINNISSLLKKIGAKELLKEKTFRNQKDYLPINWFEYKSIRGVLIEIGCGKKEVCRACFASNELFITPSLEIKPCHISPYTIPLSKLIKNKEDNKILEEIINSRRYLMKSPGENKIYWEQE